MLPRSVTTPFKILWGENSKRINARGVRWLTEWLLRDLSVGL